MVKLFSSFRKKKAKQMPERSLKKVSDYGGLLTPGIWGEYIERPDYKDKVKGLKKGLDVKSAEMVDLIIERQEFFYSVGKNKQRAYFYLEEWLSEEELKGQDDVNQFNLKEHFENKLLAPVYLQETLYFHSGLKYCPQSVVDYIKDKDFIDAGALIGDSALIFEQYSPNKIYAFEPIKENIDLINKTIEMNSLKRVVPVELGLGPKNETIEITYNATLSIGSSASLGKDEEKRSMQIVTVDDYVEENNLHFGLLKMDVEGFESQILNGAINAIKKHRPLLLISIYHSPSDFFEIKPFIESLNSNYKFMVRKLACGCTHGETMLIGYPGELQ